MLVFNKFLPYIIILVLSTGSLYGVYKYGQSSARQESIELDNKNYKDTRRNTDEGIRSAPSNPDSATEWLRRRAKEKSLN